MKHCQVRREVLRFLLRRGKHGATDCELYQALEMNRDTVRPRRCELRDRGLVADSKRKRKSEFGKPCIVWIVQPGITLTNFEAKFTNRRPASSALTRLQADPVSPAPTIVDRCPRCESAEFVDYPIHKGRSVRRDCAACHRTFSFSVWPLRGQQ